MVQLIPVFIILPLLVFYFWMFWDMANNNALPGNPAVPLRWPPTTKFAWTLAFIFLNVLAAGYYYFTEYKKEYK
jgi:hypothetical protein